MEIKQKIIPAGSKHRPMTNPKSSLYKKVMKPSYITIHNDYSTAGGLAGLSLTKEYEDNSVVNELTLAEITKYILSDECEKRPASWHFSVDDKEIWQSLPLNESGWHAGDNLGPGNTTTIGIEICYHKNIDDMKSEENGAWLAAKLIKEIPSLKPFPECMKMHYDWSGKNCPLLIRGRVNGWQQFVNKVGAYLKEPEVSDIWYRVVAGSFKDRDNADLMQRELKARGYPAFIDVYRKG